ncbi:MATE family efflux transporter [Sedimentibacter hydroxybenzoicus]|uniref:MATE family efflux transporter n=1 Tax=Sedimentibacter hydroxybenzoicus TaxID=29345 RepID=UPI002ADE8894|nr:MATE family efflux transporter [Sedimentibacter hydroxybenzoicus]
MNKEINNDLGTAGVGKLLFSLAIPAITAQLVNMLYNIIDRIYIGHMEEIGPSALTGVGITMPIIMIISAFSSLICMGGSPRAAIKMGENNYDEAEKILGNCFSSLLAISITLTVLFLIFGENLLCFFGASEKTIEYGLKYLNIYVCGTIFVQLTLGLNSFISTQGFAKFSMITVIIGAAANIILDPIFMFGLNMGVKGAAAATVLSQALSTFWVLKFLTGKKSKLKIRINYLKCDKSILIPVLLLGISPFIMQSTESLLNIAFNTSLQKYGGDTAVGSMTILTSIMQVVHLPIVGLTQGAQPIISYNYGAKNNDRVKNTFKLLFKSAFIYSTSIWILIMAFPGAFISLFTNDPALKEFSMWAVQIYLAAALVIAAQNSCQQTFVALGQAKISMFLALLRKIVLLIPLIFILPYFFENKVFAVFLAEPISDFIAASVTTITFMLNINRILETNESLR